MIKIWNSQEKISFNSEDFRKLKKSIKLIADSARTSININNDERIFDEIKRYYYKDIIIYNELNLNQNVELEDVMKLYELIKLRLDDLSYSREFISINLDDIQHKTDKGILGQTFMMDLYGKNNRIKVDYNIVITILESLISMQLNISDKYNNFAKIIAEQVNYDDELTDSNTKKIYDNDINRDKDSVIVNLESHFDDTI